MVLAIIDAFDKTISAWGHQQSWPAEQVLRLLLAAVAGALVGIERELRGRDAGFRTNILVCVGSALVMIVSITFAARQWSHQPGINLNIDPARIAYGIMTGVGFLGAGTIIKNNGNIRGLTTAASIWCVAAVGMAAGFGMYTLTLISTLLIVVALWVLGYMDKVLPKPHFRILIIRRTWNPGVIAQTVERIKQAGVHCGSVTFERTSGLSHVDISLHVRYVKRERYFALERTLESDPDYHLIASRKE